MGCFWDSFQFLWVSGRHVQVMAEGSSSLSLFTSDTAQMKEESGQYSNKYQSNVIYGKPQGIWDKCFNCY